MKTVDEFKTKILNDMNEYASSAAVKVEVENIFYEIEKEVEKRFNSKYEIPDMSIMHKSNGAPYHVTVVIRELHKRVADYGYKLFVDSLNETGTVLKIHIHWTPNLGEFLAST